MKESIAKIPEDQQVIFQENWITVTRKNHGEGKTYIHVYCQPSVHVLPITAEGKLVIIHENRPGENKSRWLVVSGSLDKKDKSPLETAQEELAEEAGLQAKNWQIFMEKPYQGKALNEHRYYYVATGLSPIEVKNPDGDVVLETKEVSVEELKQMVLDGKFDWTPSAFAILKLARELNTIDY